MIRRQDITTLADRVTPRAGVFVTVKDGGDLAAIYDADGGNLIADSTMLSGIDGSFEYWVATEGTYTEEFRLSALDQPRVVQAVEISEDANVREDLTPLLAPTEFDFIIEPTFTVSQINAILEVDDARAGWIAGYYPHVGLTGDGDRQLHRCLNGIATIYKNANGTIIDHYGNDLVMDGFVLRGEATPEIGATPRTGRNARFRGTHTLLNFGSRKADEEAIISEGRVRAFNLLDIVQSEGADFDWIIGTEDGDNLYSQIMMAYSSQNAGGIKTMDCGSFALVGGQVAKLLFDKSVSPPAGINGGNVGMCRILNESHFNVSNITLVGNTIDDDIYIGTGVSGVSIDSSNIFATGKKVINNGNNGNPITQTDPDASGFMRFFYGGKDKATALIVTPDASDGEFRLTGRLVVPYSKGLYSRNSADSANIRIATVYDAEGSVQLGDGSAPNQNAVIHAGVGGSASLYVNGASLFSAAASGIVAERSIITDAADDTAAAAAGVGLGEIYRTGSALKVRMA